MTEAYQYCQYCPSFPNGVWERGEVEAVLNKLFHVEAK